MVLLPCSACCGDACPGVNGDCLSVTFAGFAHGDPSECNECGHLNGTYVLKRDPIDDPVGTATAVAATGSGAVFEVVLARNDSRGYWYVAAVNVIEPGSGYPESVALSLSLTGVVAEEEREPAFEVASDGTITGVVVTNGGRLYAPPLCQWSCVVCPVCPANMGSYGYLEIRLIPGTTQNTIRVRRGRLLINPSTYRRSFSAYETIYEATADVVETPWSTFEFSPESAVEGCDTNGTATVAVASCASPNGCGDCCIPDQISLTTRGWGQALGWQSQNGGAPGMSLCGGDEGPAGEWGNVFCGECESPEDGCRVRFVGNASGPSNYSVFELGRNATGILDRVNPQSYQPWRPGDPCIPIMYLGPMPSLAFAGGTPYVDVDCAGLPASAMVTLSHQDLTSSVSISPPTKDPFGTPATAQIAGVTSGSISSVSITDAGSGYAAEILERVSPEVTVTVFSSTGSGAVLEAVLEETTDSNGDPVWAVASITVVDGGADYDEYDTVIVEAASGSIGYGTYGAITVDGGVIQSASVSWPGEFHKLQGTGVASADTPSVYFTSPTGTGATATAEVDTDLESPTFGQIVSLSITNGGEAYELGGTGWIASISGVYGLVHLDTCLVSPASYSAPCDDPDLASELEGAGFGACTGVLSAKVPIATRVTPSLCPTSLLGRTYPMAYRAQIYPSGYANSCGSTYCLSGSSSNVLTVTSWGEDSLEIEISGA